jgi:hypothetical protein
MASEDHHRKKSFEQAVTNLQELSFQADLHSFKNPKDELPGLNLGPAQVSFAGNFALPSRSRVSVMEEEIKRQDCP